MKLEMGFRLAGYNTITMDGTEKSIDFQLSEAFSNLEFECIFTCNAMIHGYMQNLIIEDGNYYVAQKAVANAKISLNIMP